MIKKIGYFDKDKTFRVLKDITKNEETQIFEFERVLGNYFNDIVLYKMVLKNYNDLIETIKKYEVEVDIDRNINIETNNTRIIELNLLILNFLTTFRTFLDHHETRIKREYGKDSKEANEFKNYCSIEFDSNPAYRFFYKFRNYCQHCGVPISNISMKLIKNSTGNEVVELDISLEKEILLQSFDWGSIVKNDIENSKEKLDVKELLIMFNGSIDNIHKGIINIKQFKIINAYKNFLSYSYRPEVGLISVGIITCNSLEEYKQGNVSIHPIICSNIKEIAEDMQRLGISKLNITRQEFLLDTL